VERSEKWWRRCSTRSVDPGALLAAMGAVATTLPPEHRKSLATDFRIIAESLEA
jgi:hypothetical protein